MSNLELLGRLVSANGGSIPAVRVSSAQARGAAKEYPYWGPARYEIRYNSCGLLAAIPAGRAKSARRSYRLAVLDAKNIAQAEKRLYIERRGPLTDEDAARILQDPWLQIVLKPEAADYWRKLQKHQLANFGESPSPETSSA